MTMGLVLTGGGARAAYQAGVLAGLAELLGTRAHHPLFPVLTGVSAGAINSAFLASQADDFAIGAAGLEALWSGIEPEHVLRADAATLGTFGARWMAMLSLGGLGQRGQLTYLLDTRPLRKTLERFIDFPRLRTQVARGILRGFAVTATNYGTGLAVTFVEGDPSIRPWVRSTRISRRAVITLDHVLASAAIPILFGPVRVGPAFYGDGGIRQHTPLSPAIHLGADRIIAVGIRYRPPPDRAHLALDAPMERISIADVTGVVLNSIFLDSLDTDLERLERINRTVSLLRPEDRARTGFPLRSIPVLAIRPSEDLGTLASEEFHRFPWMLRHLLRGIGASDERGWDLVSYLAFTRSYTRRLVELGRHDVRARCDELEAFLGPERPPSVGTWPEAQPPA